MRVAVFVLVWAASNFASAVIETYTFSDPQLESRYHVLSQELRCPKCQNQNIADSNAPISRDLRALLHQQLEAGKSDEQILAFMVERYGEFVRYRPGVDRNTLVLWYGPGALTVLGLLALGWHLRRRGGASNAAPSAQLTAEERAQLNEKLAEQQP